MARKYAPLMCAIWDDETFRSFSCDAQRLYMFLLSQRKMSMVGLLPLTVRSWARAADDLTADGVRSALDELEVERYVVIDEDTEELLIRTVVKHDPPRGIKSIKAAWRTVDMIESDTLRTIVVAQLPPNPDAPSDGVSETRIPMVDAPSDGARACACAATVLPSHLPTCPASSSGHVQVDNPQSVDNPGDNPDRERAQTVVTNLTNRFTA